MNETTATAERRAGLPGLTLRPYRGESDLPIIVEIINRQLEGDGVPFREDVGHLTSMYSNPSANFDPARDTTIAEVNGVPVAYGDRAWVDTTLEPAMREYRMDGSVLPEWQRKGIGTALLHHSQARQLELARTHETDLPRIFGSWTSDRMAGAIALLKENGFEEARHFYEMTRPLNEAIPDVPTPDGLEFRAVRPDEIRKIWQADVEAFKDHWGGFEDSEESYQRWISRPDFDTSLWVVAFDGEQVAGASINAISTEENEALGVKRGWLHSVFTTREYRRRGIARAAVARSLSLLKERGLDTGILGVDATNPTGAVRVYEGVGFSIAERSTAWRKSFEV
ncbi:MAG TPA: GNAT family N-acetyltransferase [Candidatus Limnocylindria bacterium]|nr:GNAT family N-acetyltransferase [Candidatus Limnocylindria bacterium]